MEDLLKKTVATLAVVGALVAAIVVPAAPAGATVTGAVAFHCTAQLPAFPAASGSGTCGSDVTPSIGVGVGAGVDDDGNPYAIAGVGDFNASFTYNEACVASEPPVLGEANGSASTSGATAVHNGALTTASLSTDFSWTRVGLVAVILTDSTQVTFGNGGSATAGAPGAAVGAFAPIIGPNNVCPNGGSLSALVAGATAQPL